MRDDHSSLPIKMYDFKLSCIPDCYLIIESLRSLLYVFKAKTIQSHLLNSIQRGANQNSLRFNGRDYLYLRGIFLRNAPENIEYSYTDDFVNIGVPDLHTFSSILGAKSIYMASWKYHTLQVNSKYNSQSTPPPRTSSAANMFVD